MASNPHRDPDVIIDRYDKDPQWNEYPVVPIEERDDWFPFRPICKKVGYSLPAAIDERWTANVFNWRFKQILAEGRSASPGRFMIHKSWLKDFLETAGVTPDEDSLLDIGIRYQKALEKVNDAFDVDVEAAQRAFDEAMEAAQQKRIEAQEQADDDFMDDLSAYENR